MNQEINSILYAALCACLGLSPNSSQASRLIREAYQEPENAPRLLRNTDAVYYSAAPDPTVKEAPLSYAAAVPYCLNSEFPGYRRDNIIAPACTTTVLLRIRTEQYSEQVFPENHQRYAVFQAASVLSILPANHPLSALHSCRQE